MDMNEKTLVDKVSEMPEVSDFVPELVCLGIDVAICGVIYLCFPTCYPKVKTEYSLFIFRFNIIHFSLQSGQSITSL